MNDNIDKTKLIKMLLSDISPLKKRDVILFLYELNEKEIKKNEFNIINTRKKDLTENEHPSIIYHPQPKSKKTLNFDSIIDSLKSEEIDKKINKINKIYNKILEKKYEK